MNNRFRPAALIVDDEPPVRRLAALFLQTAGWSVYLADGGEGALHWLMAHGEPDLLVTDLRMPGISGERLAAAARSMYPSLKVLYLTGHAHTLFEASAALGDHEAFLEKPFSAPGLREAASLVTFGTMHVGTLTDSGRRLFLPTPPPHPRGLLSGTVRSIGRLLTAG